MAVHGKYGKPCPVCGEPVQRIVYAHNEANYCARCQTGGRLLSDRALSRLLGRDWPQNARRNGVTQAPLSRSAWPLTPSEDMKDPGRFNRWLRFNGIGALGAGLQLAVLGVLTRLTPLHYLWATAVAVEATVLHNFCWHERWTWSDRPSASRRHVYRRLGRFQLTNGLISVAGNLVLMRVFAGGLGMDTLAANIVAILICSLANFGASEWLVFRRRGGRRPSS